MRAIYLTVLFFLSMGVASAEEATPILVQVYDPYIELHTGPGRGFPIFHVVDRDERIEILVRRTDWFRVKTEHGIEGWVERAQMLLTLNPDGSRVAIKEASQDDFIVREWEVGALGGDFGGAAIITFYGNYHFTENISVDASLSQAVGNVSSSILLSAGLLQEPFPEWRASPFFTLGTGIIDTTPKSSLALAQDRSDQFVYYGLGLRMHLTKRLMARLDYRSYVIFSSRDTNEDVDEWKAGFAFFF